jgi:hypothetical protein
MEGLHTGVVSTGPMGSEINPGHGAKAQNSRVLPRSHLATGFGQITERAPDLLAVALPFFRQSHGATGARKELCSERRLDRVDLLADRRRREMQLGSGRAKAAEPARGFDGVQEM